MIGNYKEYAEVLDKYIDGTLDYAKGNARIFMMNTTRYLFWLKGPRTIRPHD